MKRNKILLPKNPSHAKTPWLWIGTWSMGGEGFGPHDERESLRVLESAAENNIRHFDTAGFYGRGKSEHLLQKIISRNREEYFISSKGGLVWKGRRVEHRASPEALRDQLHESFDRLKTDYLDLYQLHWPDPKVPVRESIDALIEFRNQGLIRHWGVGNMSEFDIYHTLSECVDIPHQVHFNPVHRRFSLLHSGERECINCIVSPLEQGLLVRSRNAAGTADIGKKDIRRKNPYFNNLKVLIWLKGLNEFLQRQRHLSIVTVILTWICAQPHVHVIIPGPRKPAQLKELLRFRTDVEEYGLLSSEEGGNIISREKVFDIIPPDVWKHLSKGP